MTFARKGVFIPPEGCHIALLFLRLTGCQWKRPAVAQEQLIGDTGNYVWIDHLAFQVHSEVSNNGIAPRSLVMTGLDLCSLQKLIGVQQSQKLNEQRGSLIATQRW